MKTGRRNRHFLLFTSRLVAPPRERTRRDLGRPPGAFCDDELAIMPIYDAPIMLPIQMSGDNGYIRAKTAA
jgi:hypothetical protein